MSVTPFPGFSAPRRSRTVLWLLLGLLAVLSGGTHALPPTVALLEDGFTQERKIGGGEVHAFSVDLQAGQFLRVLVEEQGVDLVVRLFDSQGDLVAEADNYGIEYAEVTEDLAVLAADTGPHRLEVTLSKQPYAIRNSGRYVLRVEGPRVPAEADKPRAEAVQAAWNSRKTAGDTTEQIRSLKRAADLWHAAGDTENEFEILFGIGRKRYEELKARDRALEDFQRGAEFWHSKPGRRSRVFENESLTWVGRCLRHAERYDEARAVHEKALSMSRDLEVVGLQAENTNLLGVLDYEAGELQRAMDWFAQALPLARKAGDRRTEYRLLNNLAVNHEQLGYMQQALDLYLQALAMSRAIPDPKSEIILLNNLGLTYDALGEPDKAFDHFELAIEKSDVLKEHDRTGRILINQAVAHRRQGQLDKAQSSLERALAIGRSIGSSEVQVFALAHLAFLMVSLEKPEQAVEYAREAVGLAVSLASQAISQFALGSALQARGEPSSAQSALCQALHLASQQGYRDQQAQINLALARIGRDSGALDSALSHVRAAIDLIESQRGRVIDPELKTSYLASKQDYYELRIETLMALHAKRPDGGFAAAALEAGEQARARGLLDLLNEADVALSADLALIEKERRARDEVSLRDSYWRTLGAEKESSADKLSEAERKLESAIEHHRRVQVELRRSSPQYAALTQPQILDVGEIQRQLLDGRALLLEYSLGAKRSFLWVVGPDFFASFELPGGEDIEKVARHYYELLTVRNNQQPDESVPAWKMRIKQADAEAESAARELSRLILGPVENVLEDRTLLIVADGALQYIPFAALPVPGTEEPLAARHEIVNLPSASVLAILRRELRDQRPAAQTLAIFADAVFQKDDERLVGDSGKTDQITQAKPVQRGGGTERDMEKGIDLSKLRRLTSSKKEADEIAALIPADEVFKAVGFNATKEAAVSDRLKGFRIVHFATHGLLDPRPELTALVLSLYNENGERRDGLLRLADIYSLRLNADLVVLSACQTALGKEIRGEGLVGLTRGFMNAGAPRVLASLWSVEDRATAELMTLFYRGMLQEELAPAAALRKAQLEMAKKPAWKSPYFWAGFSLQGEWR
jgi:CHAT domain-containing protein/tetratricopeptide (TPR) repeat protein